VCAPPPATVTVADATAARAARREVETVAQVVPATAAATNPPGGCRSIA
jgi:hypothetical protein